MKITNQYGRIDILKLGSKELDKIKNEKRIVQIENFANSNDFVIIEYIDYNEKERRKNNERQKDL